MEGPTIRDFGLLLTPVVAFEIFFIRFKADILITTTSSLDAFSPCADTHVDGDKITPTTTETTSLPSLQCGRSLLVDREELTSSADAIVSSTYFYLPFPT